MTKLFLFDTYGTTTDINFAQRVLLPYSEIHLQDFILHHHLEPVVAKAIAEVKQTTRKEEGEDLNLDGVIERLLQWHKEDRRHASLKEIQAHIWDIGYSKNEIKGHVYDDIKPLFMKILDSGARIGIFSSENVHAQKLIFGYSKFGDLTPLISFFFDKEFGGKRELSSYLRIAEAAGVTPESTHFFSDSPEELAAAQTVGMVVTQVLRSGDNRARDFQGIKDFISFSTDL